MENFNVNSEKNGDIKISDEVIATIAAVATKEVQGISGLNLSFTDEITSKFVKKNATKSIKVTQDENDLIIDISVVVKTEEKLLPAETMQIMDIVTAKTDFSADKIKILTSK